MGVTPQRHAHETRVTDDVAFPTGVMFTLRCSGGHRWLFTIAGDTCDLDVGERFDVWTDRPIDAGPATGG